MQWYLNLINLTVTETFSRLIKQVDSGPNTKDLSMSYTQNIFFSFLYQTNLIEKQNL